MNEQEIVDFIETHRSIATPEAIKDALVSSGVEERLVDAAFKKSGYGVVMRVVSNVSAPPALSVSAAPISSVFPIPENVLPQMQEKKEDENVDSADSFLAEEHVSPAEPFATRAVPAAGEASDVAIANKPAVAHAKRTLPFLVGLFACFLFGGGAFAYWTFVIEPRLSLPEIMEQAAGALANVRSLAYKGSLEITVKHEPIRPSGLAAALAELSRPFSFVAQNIEVPKSEGTVPDEKFTFAFSGTNDATDPANVKASFRGAFSGMSGSTAYSMGLDVRTIGRTGFLKVHGLAPLDERFEMLNDAWIRADMDDKNTQALYGSFAHVSPNDVAQAPKLSPETEKKIEEMIRISDVLLLTEGRSEVSSLGVPLYHISVTIDKERLTALMTSIIVLVVEDPAISSSVSRPETIDDPVELRGMLRQVFDSFEKTQGELWIGKEDFLPRKVRTDLEIFFEPFAARFSLALLLELDRFNEVIPVVEPTGAIEFSEALQKFMPSEGSFPDGGQSGPPSAFDQQRILDVHSIAFALIAHKEKHGSYPENLDALVTEKLIAAIPRDPQTGAPYSFAHASDGMQYHLGTTVSLLATDLQLDADFDSMAASWQGGFLGADAVGCTGEEGKACYDVMK